MYCSLLEQIYCTYHCICNISRNIVHYWNRYTVHIRLYTTDPNVYCIKFSGSIMPPLLTHPLISIISSDETSDSVLQLVASKAILQYRSLIKDNPYGSLSIYSNEQSLQGLSQTAAFFLFQKFVFSRPVQYFGNKFNCFHL